MSRHKEPIEHGTLSGHTKERERGLPICDECRDAFNVYQRNRRATSTWRARRPSRAKALS